MSSTGYKKNKKRKKSVASYSSKDYNFINETIQRALEAALLAPTIEGTRYTHTIHPAVYQDLKDYRLEEQEEEYGEWYDLTQI